MADDTSAGDIAEPQDLAKNDRGRRLLHRPPIMRRDAAQAPYLTPAAWRQLLDLLTEMAEAAGGAATDEGTSTDE
jgi:hypothetical protein